MCSPNMHIGRSMRRTRALTLWGKPVTPDMTDVLKNPAYTASHAIEGWYDGTRCLMPSSICAL